MQGVPDIPRNAEGSHTLNLRKTPVARMAFAAPGAELDDTAWNARKKSLINQLKTQLPALRRLKSSSIQTTTELSDNQLLLVVYLEESPQTQLPSLYSTQVGRDLYLQDLQRVRDQQANLHERFHQAIRSTDYPTDSVALQELRGLLWQSRREGRIQLHSSSHGEWLDIPSLPSTLPQSALIKVEVEVQRLTRDEVGVQISEHLSCPATQRVLFERSRKVTMLRHPKLRDMESTLKLATLMQQNAIQEVEVEIEYSWINGQPHRLTLVSLGSTAKANATNAGQK